MWEQPRTLHSHARVASSPRSFKQKKTARTLQPSSRCLRTEWNTLSRAWLVFKKAIAIAFNASKNKTSYFSSKGLPLPLSHPLAIYRAPSSTFLLVVELPRSRQWYCFSQVLNAHFPPRAMETLRASCSAVAVLDSERLRSKISKQYCDMVISIHTNKRPIFNI